MMFQETQSFPPWVHLLGLAVVVVMLIVFGVTYINIELNVFIILIFGISLIASIGPFLLLKLSKLKTEIDKQSIRMNFSPFSKKIFAWSEIKSAEVIDYGFVGGWGVRLGTKYGTVYNTQGHEGLLLKFKTGKSIVIGTQRKEELQHFLRKHISL